MSLDFRGMLGGVMHFLSGSAAFRYFVITGRREHSGEITLSPFPLAGWRAFDGGPHGHGGFADDGLDGAAVCGDGDISGLDFPAISSYSVGFGSTDYFVIFHFSSNSFPRLSSFTKI
jgi:hypothetical protein